MSELEKVIAEDIKAGIGAFKEDAFDNVNVFANRVMANAVFGDNKKIFLPGFFMKDVAFTFGLLKIRKGAGAFSTAKSHGFSYLESLEKSLVSLNEEQLWKDFQIYGDKIRKFEMTDWEQKSYSDNTKFTNESFKWLLAFLQSHEAVLSDPRNFLIKGIINEMTRVYRVHSATLHDIVLLCLMTGLGLNYDYACRIWDRPDARIIDERQMKELILPTVNKIVTLSNQEFKIDEADALLWILVRNWREFFVQFGELLPPGVAVQKGIELPEELKKKLTESLTRTLEKEM